MRYETECPDRPKFFGFYSRLMQDKGQTALYDQAYDRALIGTKKRAIGNTAFLVKLMTHYLATTSAEAEGEAQ
jgi:hypothetical protein